jgi:hypothetical protein
MAGVLFWKRLVMFWVMGTRQAGGAWAGFVVFPGRGSNILVHLHLQLSLLVCFCMVSVSLSFCLHLCVFRRCQQVSTLANYTICHSFCCQPSWKAPFSAPNPSPLPPAP